MMNHEKDPREIIKLLLKKGRDWQKSDKFRDDVTICILEAK
jgi:hypothetical protein